MIRCEEEALLYRPKLSLPTILLLLFFNVSALNVILN
jgi:hypothetical protein